MTIKSLYQLDDRIESIDDIQTILHFDVNCIGCKGYFFDEFIQTKDLSKCRYGELVDIVIDNHDLCFKAELENKNTIFFRFFIPASDLKPVEKKYRSFTLAEWIEKHEIGEVIHFRNKSEGIEFRHMYMGYAFGKGKDITKFNVGTVTLGVASYSFNYLFEDYEIEINGEWKKFGVLDEEKE